jgi:hypothetical protein
MENLIEKLITVFHDLLSLGNKPDNEDEKDKQPKPASENITDPVEPLEIDSNNDISASGSCKIEENVNNITSIQQTRV